MSRLSSNSLLFLTALIWGTAFVPQYLGMQHIGPFAFTSFRFALGALFISPLVYREYQRLKSQKVLLESDDLLAWSAIGLLLSGGAIAQQIGIPDTTITNAGFITALYVPLVPIVLWIFQKKIVAWYVWLANLICVFGVYLLSGGNLNSLTRGDLWVFIGSLFWSIHVVYIGTTANKKNSPYILAAVQFIVCALCSGILALFLEQTTFTQIYNATPTILYGGVLSVGIGYTLQVVAQRYAHAADAALILSAEFLIAAVAGAVWLNEKLNPQQMLGALLIFMAIIIVQLLPLWQNLRFLRKFN